MFIERVTIENFRVYCGVNDLSFSVNPKKNVSIVSGNNGYGKTSFLTSLVWCMYGKLMADVDERYRKEIYESGGYKKYCEKILNLFAAKKESKFSVSLKITKLLIPSLPCEYVQVTRTYNVSNNQENVEILIDGKPNELTKDVGSEIFINDFILPKEIAKFFFFDAEKIVSLAEMRTTDEKRALSKAYAEVLGIKKYLDLKDNLENLRIRLKKNSPTGNDKEKLDKLRKQLDQQNRLVEHIEEGIKEKTEELNIKKTKSDKLQEQLIREGTSLTLNDLKDYKQMKDHLGEEISKIRNKFKDLVELAPFAVAAQKLMLVKKQLDIEKEASERAASETFLIKKVDTIRKALKKNKKIFALNDSKEKLLIQLITENLLSEKAKSHKTLLDFSIQEQNRFLAIFDNLKNSYSQNFKQLVADYKKKQSSYLIIIRKLQDAESKENDPVIKAIREDKVRVDSEVRELEHELIELQAKKLNLQNEHNNFLRQISELAKRAEVEDVDKEKDKTATRLIGELDDFILKLKVKKKSSLESNILKELNRLMHKASFVNRVEVVIEGEIIDIELYDSQSKLIDKEGLSKGEQQLYATALLRALVSESNITFPVFIDSPLQKFDKKHAKNIIKDFYPNVSSQVILFPLLDKELNENEYNWLLPKVGSSYLIDHLGNYQSKFRAVTPSKIFEEYHGQEKYAYHN